MILPLGGWLFSLPTAAYGAERSYGWPTYGYDFSNTRHFNLITIKSENVGALAPIWRFESSVNGKFEASPVVIGRTMYVTTGPDNALIALDAVTGRPRWRYAPTIGLIAACCGHLNRGVAVDGRRVFFATLDGRLIALSAIGGRKIWEVAVGDPKEGFSETMAPLAWRGMVFIGSSGGEFGIRGSFTAYRQSDGKRLWRWWAVSPRWEGHFIGSVHGVSLHRDIAKERADAPRHRDAWMHGGGPVWMTPALDPTRSSLYLTTGNPSPNYSGDERPGDNLYTDSIVALDAASGRLKWYYQETPHDVWDYDAASPAVLFDTVDFAGRKVAAVGQAGKTGWFYVVNRDNGKLIRVSQNFIPQTTIYNTTRSASVAEPGGLGGTTGPISYHAFLHLAFIAAFDRPDRHEPGPTTSWHGGNELWEAGTQSPSGLGRNYACAIDTWTGKVVWKRYLSSGENHGMAGGTLSAGNIVFVPDPNGKFYAFDAASGKLLWQFAATTGVIPNTSFSQRVLNLLRAIKRALLGEPAPVYQDAHNDAPPIAYSIEGREYIALLSNLSPQQRIRGNAITVFALPK